MEIWNCNKDIKDDGKRNRFWHSLQSRIDSWKRDYFPLDIINNLITDKKSKKDWKTETFNRIDILTSDGKYYNVNDVDAIKFQETGKDGSLSVYIIRNGEELQVLTPCANGNTRAMCLHKTSHLSIDHEIPLNIIVNQILNKRPEIRVELAKILDAKKENPELKAKEIADKIRDDVNVVLLKEFKDDVLKDTSCVLMERGENSKKSNVTLFQKYRKEGNKYILIIAEGVVNPEDRKKYTIARIFENHSYGPYIMEKEE